MSLVFNITHDDGTLDAYNSFANATDLSAEAAAALADTPYGLQTTIDSTANTYGQKDITQLTSTAYRFRIYFDPHTLTMANGDSFVIAYILTGTSGRAQIRLTHDGSNYKIFARLKDDSASYRETAEYTITDDPHYIEVLCQYATGAATNDGILTLWIDGAQQETITNIDLYNLTKPDTARLGAVASVDAGTSGTIYSDEFVLRDDDTEIGPITMAGFAAIF